ncbi:MAG: universal stress protein [bacterium]
MGKGSYRFPPRQILIGIDGEARTEAAVRWAVQLAAVAGSRVTAVHVKDPYLKQFSNDIYAQGRQVYRDHVDAKLAERAAEVVAAFEAVVRSVQKAGRQEAGAGTGGAELQYRVTVRAGDPVTELAAAAAETACDLVVLGGKNLRGLERWRSGKLPERLAAKIAEVPLLLVPAGPGT